MFTLRNIGLSASMLKPSMLKAIMLKASMFNAYMSINPQSNGIFIFLTHDLLDNSIFCRLNCWKNSNKFSYSSQFILKQNEICFKMKTGVVEFVVIFSLNQFEKLFKVWFPLRSINSSPARRQIENTNETNDRKRRER